jgi:peroxiredoxin
MSVDSGRAGRNNRLMAVVVGTLAPSFRLPSGQGPEIGLEDYRARSHALVWFTKGIACPFCRRQMVQMGKLYPRLRELGAEVLLVAPTRPEQARLYMRRFPVPYPYLCDPGYQVRRAWGRGYDDRPAPICGCFGPRGRCTRPTCRSRMMSRSVPDCARCRRPTQAHILAL